MARTPKVLQKLLWGSMLASGTSSQHNSQIHLRDSLNADETLLAQERKDRDVALSPKTNAGIMQAIHGLLVSDSEFVAMDKAAVREAMMFGVLVVQRECRDRCVSVHGITGNSLEMKKFFYEARRWVWDVTEEESQYDVRSVNSKKMVDGIWWYSVTWLDGDTTEEPRCNLDGVEAMVDEFERKWFEYEAMNTQPAKESRVARKAVPVEVAGAEAGEPSELQQAMIMMA